MESQKSLGLAISLLAALIFGVESARRLTETASVEEAVSSAVADLDTLLTTRKGKREVITALNGLTLSDGIERIDFDHGLHIRRLTGDEIADLGSNDIFSESRYDLTSRFVTAAVISESSLSIELSPYIDGSFYDLTSQQLYQEQTGNILRALHLLKSGRVGILASFTKLLPTVLPNMSGHISAPLIVNPCSMMELGQDDVAKLIELYRALAKTRLNELNIAAARLLDAESRISSVDAVLDAVIGLEVLLNPNDRAELSFRVALNYAYLGPVAERRERYENVRDVQVTRNRVVHGGLNLASKDVARLHEHATLAKSCLRDALLRFLTDRTLMGTQKLDVDFWLDRVLPPQMED
jgi:hypothetical protein